MSDLHSSLNLLPRAPALGCRAAEDNLNHQFLAHPQMSMGGLHWGAGLQKTT